MPLYLNQNLSGLLPMIPGKVSAWLRKELSNYRKTDYPINYVDVDGDKLSFLTATRAKKVPNPWDDTKLRQSARTGRVLNKLINNMLPEVDIKEFAESLSSLVNDDSLDLKVVEGQDLADVYKIPRKLLISQTDSLNNACFQGTLSKASLQIFIKNPDVIKMLTCWVNGKLGGRATLWHGTIGDSMETIVAHDRVYQCNPLIGARMRRYFKEHSIIACEYGMGLSVKVKPATMPPYFDMMSIKSGTEIVSR